MIDNVPVQAALINESAQIVAINAYWQHFAENNHYADTTFGLGRNYLDTCLAADGKSSAEARIVAEELGGVLSEQSTEKEFRTLETMSRATADNQSDFNGEILMAYRAMVDACIARTGEWGYGALRNKARAIAGQLADRDATAGDVARLHARAMKEIMAAESTDRAPWIVQ